jgi:hypothetical protein
MLWVGLCHNTIKANKGVENNAALNCIYLVAAAIVFQVLPIERSTSKLKTILEKTFQACVCLPS